MANIKCKGNIEATGAIYAAEKKLVNIDDIYPVGTIYMSVNITNPQNLFGGTWEQLKDRFLLGSGDNYVNGSVGGESNHTLTIDEMPSHNHGAVYYESYNFAGGSYNRRTGPFNISEDGGVDIPAQGGGMSHNNMPPYLVVYMWKRVE